MNYSKDELNDLFDEDDEKTTNEEWQQVGGDMNEVWDFEANNTLEGLYIEKKEGVGENRSTVYTIENAKDNKKYDMWGSTVIDNKMKAVDEGNEVRIVFKGIQKSEKSNREYKDYEIFQRPPRMRKV